MKDGAWQEWVVNQRSRFMGAWSEVMQVRHFAYLAGADVYLKLKFDIDLTVSQLVYFIILMVIGIWLIGMFMDRTHLFHKIADFGNKRNPYVIKQIKLLEEIRDSLKRKV